MVTNFAKQYSLSLHRESGLKCNNSSNLDHRPKSLPTQGEWIEIYKGIYGIVFDYVSPYTGRVDWNFRLWTTEAARTESLPTQGEWIEISCNSALSSLWSCLSLHRESGLKFPCLRIGPLPRTSLPTQGEWIEMLPYLRNTTALACLSLHRESGLKYHGHCLSKSVCTSLPTQGEWIEILPFGDFY